MMVGDTYFCGHVSRPTAGRCNECAQVRANAKPLRKLAQSNSKSEDTLADMLLELGFANKPGSQKGRQFSQRYYVAELKKAILHWHKAEIAKLFEQIRSEVIGEDEYPNEHFPTYLGHKDDALAKKFDKVVIRDRLRAEQRQALTRLEKENV